MTHNSTKTHMLIDEGALSHNLKMVRNQINTRVNLAIPVKANAYGLGAINIAKMLRCRDVHSFYVATIEEAIEIAHVVENDDIYILHPISASDYKMLRNNMIPVLNSLGELEGFSQFARMCERRLRANIFFETGMGKFGLQMHEIERAKELMTSIDCKFLMSHLACADDMAHELNKKQLISIRQVGKHFPTMQISFANSAGVWLGSDFHFNQVRPGCAIYGINPIDNIDCALKQVAKIYAKVLLVRELAQDQNISYGAHYEAKRGDKIAVVECGYADGYHRALSMSDTYVFYGGRRLRVVGRINMDVIMVDISSISDSMIADITHVELLGDNITVNELAKKAGTIGYEILTSIGNRIERIF